MAGFNYSLGCSNNMLAARERGMVNVGTWGRRWGVSAAAVIEVMRPAEAHHTGTGRRGRSRLTYVIAGATEPTADQLAAMRGFDAEMRLAKHVAKEARKMGSFSQPVRVARDCVARYLTWPTTRGARRIPREVVEPLAELRFFTDGSIVGVEPPTGRLTTGWERLSGLVVARAGQVIFTNRLNEEFDCAEEIARRIAPPQNSAGAAGELVAAQAAGSITPPAAGA